MEEVSGDAATLSEADVRPNAGVTSAESRDAGAAISGNGFAARITRAQGRDDRIDNKCQFYYEPHYRIRRRRRRYWWR
jgi:hypothetical protein